MVTIEEARQNILSARQQLEEQKAISERNKEIIEEQKKRLPNELSQKSLRTTYGGLKGREQRRNISGLRSDLTTKESLINQAEEEIFGYGKEVSSYEENLNKYESEVKAIQEQQSALQNVIKHAEAGHLSDLAFYGEGLEKEYAIKYLKLSNNEREDWLKEVNSLQASLPSTEKLVIDYNKMKISGIESGVFGSSLSITEYNKRIDTLQKQAGSIQNKVIIGSVPNLKITEAPKTSIFSGEMFPMVSAMTTSSIKQPAELKQGFILSSLGKASSFVERTPVLREIAKPSLIFEDIAKASPKTAEYSKSFLFGSPDSKVQNYWSPVLPLAIPVKMPTNQITIWQGSSNKAPIFTEIQQPLSIFGKQSTASFYQIERQITPPKVVLKDGGKGLFFAEPKYIAPRYETTIARTLGDAPFQTITTRFGGVAKVDVLGGASKPIVPTNIAEFNALSKTQQYAWQKMAEDISGRPVSLQNVPKVLSENYQYAQGYIKQISQGKLNYAKDNLRYTRAEQGKTTSQYETSSRFKKVGETDRAEYYKGNIFFKDITKPFARASGNVPKMEGTIIKIKEPIVIGEDSGIGFIKPANIQKTPMSKTFGQSEKAGDILTNQPDLFIQPSPKPIPKVTTQKTINTKGGLNENGKLGLSVGIFGGQSGGISNREFSGNTFNNFISGRSEGRSKQMETQGVPTTSAKEDQNILTNQKDIFIQKNVPSLSPIQEQKPLERTKNIPRETQKPFQAETPVQILKIGTPQKQIYYQKQTTKQPQKIKVPTQPKPKTPIKPIKIIKSDGLIKRIYKKITEEPEIIEVFGKRFGKDSLIAKTTSKRKADEELNKFLKKGLGRSGFLTSKGEKIESGLLKNFQYRPSKKEPLRVVQKSKFSLSSWGEKSEIKQSRKYKKKKKFNWFS